MPSLKVTLVFAALVAAAAAQTTLFIPGLDDQPLTANILGTGADGTTWLVQPVTIVNSEDANGLLGPATVIAGSSTVKVIYDMPGAIVPLRGVETCQIDGAIANCEVVVVEGSRTLTSTLQETVVPITVQGGGPLSGSSAPAAATPASSAGSSATSGASNTASATTPSATAPPPATSDNGVGKLGSSVLPLAIAVGAGVLALF